MLRFLSRLLRVDQPPEGDIDPTTVLIKDFVASCSSKEPRKLHHSRQKEEWDCGIACILMMLDAEQEHIWREKLIQIIDTKSIWSVDLVFTLDRLNFRNLFLTQCYLNENHRDVGFYGKEFDQDAERIRERVPLLHHPHRIDGRIPIKTIVDAIKVHCVAALVLVDGNRLNRTGRDTFTGHYILLYDSQYQSIYYYDPAFSSDARRISVEQLKLCITPETDQDIILIDYCH